MTAALRWLGPTPPWAVDQPAVRVIVDNDFAGDPDDLVQLAHHLMCPSVTVRAVISSHLRPGDGFDPGPHSAANGARGKSRANRTSSQCPCTDECQS